MHDRVDRRLGWAPQKFSSLVPLRPDGAGRPLFLVPGFYGMIAEMRGLAEALRSGRPVYGLQPRGLDPAQAADDRIEAMARHYLDEMRRLQPQGPYAMAGFSFGGQVVFEIAQQLREAGEEIELLALIDAPMQRRFLPRSAVFRFRLRRMAQGIRRVMTPPQGRRLPRPWSAFRDWQENRREKQATAFMMASALPPLPPHRRALCDAHLRAVYSYEPRRYDGPVLFLQAAMHSPHWADPVPAWRRWCPGLELHGIPGDHHSILQPPDVAALAAHLDRHLSPG